MVAMAASFVLRLVALSTSLCGLAAKVTERRSWMQQKELQQFDSLRQPHKLLTGVVNLDLAPEDRWNDLVSNHTKEFQDTMKYLESYIPKWVQPMFFSAMREVVHYRGIPDDYRREIKGIAKALNMDVAIVVMGNLLYELEHLGTECSVLHATGPCRGHHTYDPETDTSYPFRLPRPHGRPGPPGMCTSVVAEDRTSSILHGRNLDWELPLELRGLMVDVSYQRGGKTLFVGSGLVAYVGILTAMKPGQYSWSLNSRENGGSLLTNFLESVLHGSTPATMHARAVFEKADGFDDAVQALSTGRIINPAYFIVGGAQPGQGIVITRDRAGAADRWCLNSSQVNGWYRLQTNTDHWELPAANDDRMFPGYALMQYVGREDLTPDTLAHVMKTWPLFNSHTDFTAIIDARVGVYLTVWWDDGGNSTVTRSAVVV